MLPYINIILTLGENIIGYVSILLDGSFDYPLILKSVLFPQINGEYQNVSEEYVKAEIKKTIDEFDTFAGHLAAVKKNLIIIDAELRIADGRNLSLPSSLYGAGIDWTSSDETVISIILDPTSSFFKNFIGIVTRQLYDADVIITATLRLAGLTDTKEFIVKVPARLEEGKET